jgi:formamidopyrimidine-DNA glycosylase
MKWHSFLEFKIMPELPEIEAYRKYIEHTSLGQRIVKVQLRTQHMLLHTTDKALKDTLEGNTFKDTFRHGKFLFIMLKSKESLMLHFGMTGDLDYTESDKPPKSYAIIFQFKNKHQLVFSDVRRLGKIALVKDVDAFIKKRGYGKDALKITKDEFLKKLNKKRTPIKASLMDQKAVAGVGNEYSDEILFQCRVHPGSSTAKLPEKLLVTIYDVMRSVLKEAVRKRAERKKLTKFYFLGNRKAGLVCPRCKGKTEWQTIGGRSSYFCPSCQKLYR